MYRILILLSVFMVLACQPVTVQRHQGKPVPVSVRVDDAAYWLEEWNYTRQLPEAELRKALGDRERAFKESGDTRTRLRLALLLAEGPAAVRDQERAMALIDGLEKTGISESSLALAALIAQTIAEQRWASDRIKELKDEIKRDEARVEELERQLQELTNIEQSIQQRETPGSRKEKE